MDEHVITGGYVAGDTLDLPRNHTLREVHVNNNPDGSYEVQYQDSDGNVLFSQRVDAQGTSSREYPHRGFRVNNMILDEWRSFPYDTDTTLGLGNLGELRIDEDGMSLHGENGEVFTRISNGQVFAEAGVTGNTAREATFTASNAVWNEDVLRELLGTPVVSMPRYEEADVTCEYNPYYRRYVEDTMNAVRATSPDYLRMPNGSRKYQRHSWLDYKLGYLDKKFGDKFDLESLPDIEDERGGALDEFLDGFNTADTTQQKEVMK